MAQKRDLRVFMRESAKTEEIVTVPGPDSIKDEDGKPIMLEIKVLRKSMTTTSARVSPLTRRVRPILPTAKLRSAWSATISRRLSTLSPRPLFTPT